MFFLRSPGHKLVDRGDPLYPDFSIMDFILDGDWHDKDLSSIVPSGTIAVYLHIEVVSDPAGEFLQFRKKSNSNVVNIQRVTTQVAGQRRDTQRKVFCNSDRIIQYFASPLGISVIFVTVTGWILK